MKEAKVDVKESKKVLYNRSHFKKGKATTKEEQNRFNFIFKAINSFMS